MSKITYYQRNRDIILNTAKEYYKDNKELLQERAKNKYRSLSEDEKDIKKQYQNTRYHNMSDEEKPRLKDYQNNYREAKKLKSILNQSLIFSHIAVYLSKNSLLSIKKDIKKTLNQYEK